MQAYIQTEIPAEELALLAQAAGDYAKRAAAQHTGALEDALTLVEELLRDFGAEIEKETGTPWHPVKLRLPPETPDTLFSHQVFAAEQTGPESIGTTAFHIDVVTKLETKEIRPGVFALRYHTSGIGMFPEVDPDLETQVMRSDVIPPREFGVTL